MYRSDKKRPEQVLLTGGSGAASIFIKVGNYSKVANKLKVVRKLHQVRSPNSKSIATRMVGFDVGLHPGEHQSNELRTVVSMKGKELHTQSGTTMSIVLERLFTALLLCSSI